MIIILAQIVVVLVVVAVVYWAVDKLMVPEPLNRVVKVGVVAVGVIAVVLLFLAIFGVDTGVHLPRG